MKKWLNAAPPTEFGTPRADYRSRGLRLGSLVRHYDGARRGEHAAYAVADGDLGVGDLGGGGAAHLAHALLQCVHAGMHVGEAAAIGVQRQFAAGGGVMLGDE